MSAQLVVIAGPDQGRVFALAGGTPLVVGRGTQSMTRLNDLRVSRVHCQVEQRGGDVVIKDLNSVGGTLVNGAAVTEHVLRPGDVVQVGDTQLRLQLEDIADLNTLPPETPGAHIPAALPLESPIAEPPPPRTGPATVPFVRRATPMPPVPIPVARRVNPPPAAPPQPTPPPAAPAPPAAAGDALLSAIPVQPRPKVLPGERLGELAETFLAHFAVGPVLAKGKSGVVFRAVDIKADRVVALKVLRPEFTRNDTEIQRFIRSMKTMMPLRHPNLVALYGAGKKGPYCWIAMEYVEGESLTEVIRRIGIAGMLDWRHAFRMAVHIGRALAFAHRRHVVHRNLTPQNVLIRKDDPAAGAPACGVAAPGFVAKLGDLMLAKATEGGMAREITRSNEVLGDLRYMSPEQTHGGQELDGRSDVYSLGALLYAVLTGQAPFQGDNLVETIVKIRQAKVEPPRKFQMSIPEALEGVVLQMLAKRPEDRYQTADELLRELERIGKFQGVPV
jgi:Protein kinase domain/Inner membrane component of T3SS, cytoplasmic domain